jgi:predicted DNA-binding transcriptional regulator AlpA
MTTSATPTAPPAQRLIDAKEVGRILGCSWRTVLRLADAGRVPWGLKLGALRRWDLREIERFIEGGCKPVRAARR